MNSTFSKSQQFSMAVTKNPPLNNC